MAMTECGHGHIYDSDIYASCPYCNSAQKIINFAATVPMGDADRLNPSYGAQAAYSADKTAPVGGGYGAPSGGMYPGGMGGEIPVYGDSGKTQPPKGYGKEERADADGGHTVGMMEKKLGLEPVVGWLVCIEGPDKGKDYKIWGRINRIGSSSKMDIAVKGDSTISGEDAARLGYDPKKNNFRLIPGNNKNNVYVNDDVVDMTVYLKPYDVIEMGQTKLAFIPFCSPRFSWEKGVIPPEEDEGGQQ